MDNISKNYEPQDFRWLGPTTTCPRCESNQFRTMVIVDQYTHEIAVWGLDAECTACNATVKLACPADCTFLEHPHPGSEIPEGD